MLNNSKDLFDVVLLFALPASGKSEVRHLLANVEEEKLQKEFHFGQTLQLDDFPYVHMMRRIDMECEKIGQPRIYYSGDETPVYDAHDNATFTKISTSEMSYWPSNLGSAISSTQNSLVGALFIMSFTHVASLRCSTPPLLKKSWTSKALFPVTISNTTIP